MVTVMVTVMVNVMGSGPGHGFGFAVSPTLSPSLSLSPHQKLARIPVSLVVASLFIHLRAFRVDHGCIGEVK